MNRWHSLLRYDLSRPQGSPHGRPENPAIRSVPLGRCDFRNVQLLNERLQDEEWRLSFLAAAVLSLLAVFYGREESFLSLRGNLPRKTITEPLVFRCLGSSVEALGSRAEPG